MCNSRCRNLKLFFFPLYSYCVRVVDYGTLKQLKELDEGLVVCSQVSIFLKPSQVSNPHANIMERK